MSENFEFPKANNPDRKSEEAEEKERKGSEEGSGIVVEKIGSENIEGVTSGKEKDGRENDTEKENKDKDQKRKDLAKEMVIKELKEIIPDDLGKRGEGVMVIERISKSRTAKKLLALFAATTLFAGAFSGKAEAGRGDYLGLEGTGERIIRDAGRGVGGGAERGLREGIEQTVLNAFGIPTRKQERESNRIERELTRQGREYNGALEKALNDYHRETKQIRNKAGLSSSEKIKLLEMAERAYVFRKAEIEEIYGARR